MSEALVNAIATVLENEGGAPGSGLHSWRCEYPEQYGKCDCLEETARMILAAICPVAWGGDVCTCP